MNLSSANAYFRQADYSKALDLYLHVARTSPDIAPYIQCNISLCRKRLEDQQATHGSLQGSTADPHTSAINLPDRAVHHFLNATLPDKDTLTTFFTSLSAGRHNHSSLRALIQCLRSSPFQRDLLWYTASAFQMSGQRLQTQSALHDDNILLADLVAIASQPSAWLRNRAAYARYLQRYCISDARAWDLYLNAPEPLGLRSGFLPERGPRNSDIYPPPSLTTSPPKQYPLLSITLATILLNERDLVWRNLMQHYAFCSEWILVEGACKGYPTRRVSEKGLSRDDTSAYIRLFPDPQGKLRFIEHGWTTCDGERAKSELRNRYLKHLRTDLLIVVDADEFYLPDVFHQVEKHFQDPHLFALTLPQIHFWKDTRHFVTGGYYDVSHTRVFRHVPGMRYTRNHNFPEIDGRFLTEYGHLKVPRSVRQLDDNAYTHFGPCCYHLGFAKSHDNMRDKTDYYIHRGEADTRPSTTKCRTAWFTDDLPDECQVRLFKGNIPTVLSTLQFSR